MLAPASGMFEAENHDFVGGLVYGVIRKIAVFSRDEFAYARCLFAGDRHSEIK
jgi:hypothetical protein